MKRQETKTAKDGEVIIETFDSLNELIKITSGRTPDKSFKGGDDLARYETEYGDHPWSGEKTFHSAVHKVLNGDEASYKLLTENLRSDHKLQGVSKNSRLQTFNDVVGYQPCVPNALMNLPQSMINQRKISRKTKVIDLLVDISHSCGVSAKEIAEYGARIVSAVRTLELAGYRVRLTAMATFGRSASSGCHVVKIRLKSENQPFDLKKIAYPIIGAGMFRRITFDWYESLPGHTYISAYGKPIRNWSGSDREKLLETLSDGPEQIYVNEETDIKEALKLKERIK